MFAHNVQVVDLEPWGLGRLGRPRGQPPPGWELPARRRSGERKSDATVVHDGERVLLVLHRGKRVPNEWREWEQTATLRRVHAKLGARRVYGLHKAAVGSVLTRAEMRFGAGDTFLEQVLTCWGAYREELGEGILIFPEPALKLPTLPVWAVAGALRTVLPPGRTALLYVVESGHVWMSVIVRQGAGGLDLVTSDRAFGAQGLDAGQFAQDAGRIAQLCAERFGPPVLGVFMTRAVWWKLWYGKQRLRTLTEAQAARDIVVTPGPMALMRLARQAAPLWAMMG